MYLLPLPAFTDNYLWLLHDGKRALVVDPGDAAPVRAALAAHGLQLASILVTHHHADHVGGVDELREATGATVYGPAHENIPRPFTPLVEGDTVDVLGLAFDVIDVPGHTAGHIAYYKAPTPAASGTALPTGATALAGHGPSPEAGEPLGVAADLPLLFCGDTLFSGGCGRLFEGTPAQMLASLDKLAALPGETVVCCAHEYTLSNLRFARAVEPGNAELAAYESRCIALRERGQPTLPATIAGERRINPFLRSRQPTIMAAARRFDGTAHDDTTVFAALRQWKNEFK